MDRIVESFSNRLYQAMQLRNLKSSQIEKISEQLYSEKKIKKIIKMPLITDYLKGRYEAKQSNIYALAMILNVSEAWLMGADVSIERTPDEYRRQENIKEYIAEDDAMYPLLDIGDIAYIYKQNTIDETNPSSNNAGTYLIELNNRRTIRRFVESQDKTYYTLQGMNISCRPINIKKEEMQQKINILGKVIRVQNSSAFK